MEGGGTALVLTAPPPALVVDSSVLIGGLLEAEASPLGRQVAGWLAGGTTQAVVPSIFPIEAANALLMAYRRQRITQSAYARLLELLERQPLRIESRETTLVRVGVFAEDHRLTFYDASYLDVAVRNSLPLATLDKALARAAKIEGVLFRGT